MSTLTTPLESAPAATVTVNASLLLELLALVREGIDVDSNDALETVRGFVDNASHLVASVHEAYHSSPGEHEYADEDASDALSHVACYLSDATSHCSDVESAAGRLIEAMDELQSSVEDCTSTLSEAESLEEARDAAEELESLVSSLVSDATSYAADLESEVGCVRCDIDSAENALSEAHGHVAYAEERWSSAAQATETFENSLSHLDDAADNLDPGEVEIPEHIDIEIPASLQAFVTVLERQCRCAMESHRASRAASAAVSETDPSEGFTVAYF
jgi:hypothetical protein